MRRGEQKAELHKGNPNWITGRSLAKWVACDEADLHQLLKDGVVMRSPTDEGYYLFFESVVGRIMRLSSTAARRKSADGIHDVAAESAQLKKAQRLRVEQQMMVANGTLVNVHEVISSQQDIVRDIRQAILSIPARIQGDLPHLVASEVDVMKRHCREILQELKELGKKPLGGSDEHKAVAD